MKANSSKNQANSEQLKTRIEEKINKYFATEGRKAGIKSIFPTSKELRSLQKFHQRGSRDKVIKTSLFLLQNRLAHPFPLKLLASVLKENGELEESIDLLEEVVLLDSKDSASYFNLANSLKALSEFDKASNFYRKAIFAKPNFPDAYFNLGNLCSKMGHIEDALRNYEEALNLRPSFFEARIGLARVLRSQGNMIDSERNYSVLLASTPRDAQLHYELGQVLREQDKYSEALPYFEAALNLDPRIHKARIERLRCMYALNMKMRVLEELDYLITSNVVDTVVGSITHRSNVKYGIEKKNLYCNDPIEYVEQVDLKTRCDFSGIFVKGVQTYLERETLDFRFQSLLDKGLQTSGNIFELDHPNIREMEVVILREVERYRLTHLKSNDGLIRHWPNNSSLNGWIIKMDNNGSIRPHIHGYGWLSGSIYINVPLKSDSNAGNLVVTLGDGNEPRSVQDSISKIVDVVTGSLVIFPASLMHYSLPFESDESRILLAFDFVPRD